MCIFSWDPSPIIAVIVYPCMSLTNYFFCLVAWLTWLMKMIVSLLVDDLRGFEYYKPKSKISYFCESTQSLGPLFLWQCLVFLFYPSDILHLSKMLVPLFSFYFSSTRKAPNNGVLLCPFVVIQLFPHNPTIYVARAPLQLLRSLVKLYLSMWLSVCQGSVTPDHWPNLRFCQYFKAFIHALY